MAGLRGIAKGPQVVAQVQQLNVDHHEPKKIIKDSDVTVTLPSYDEAKVRLGLRILNNQRVEDLIIYGVKGNKRKKVPLLPDLIGEIAGELQNVAPADGHKWVGFIASYNPKDHGNGDFVTTIAVEPFNIHDNGFQVVAIAFTPVGSNFERHHYGVATSILPGKNGKLISMTARIRSPGPEVQKKEQKKGKKKISKKRKR